MALDAVALLAAAGFRARHLDLGVPELRWRRLRLVAGGAIAADRPAPPRRRSRPPGTRTTRKTP
jgi:hypothetical protein